MKKRDFLLRAIFMMYMILQGELYVQAQGNCGVNISKQLSTGCHLGGGISSNENNVSVNLSGIVVAPYTFSWSNGATTASQIGLAQGCYTVTLTDAANCTATDTVCLPQKKWNGISIAVISKKDATCSTCIDGFAHVAGNGGVGSYTYNWTNGRTIYAGQYGDSCFLYPGSYTVCVNDSFSCACTTVTIKNSVGIIEQNSIPVKIYPNPADQNISIEFLAVNIRAEIWQIANVLGEIVLNGKFENNNTGMNSINISTLPPATYILKVYNPDAIVTKRIQKSG